MKVARWLTTSILKGRGLVWESNIVLHQGHRSLSLLQMWQSVKLKVSEFAWFVLVEQPSMMLIWQVRLSCAGKPSSHDSQELGSNFPHLQNLKL
jgi:hypothetical protein